MTTLPTNLRRAGGALGRAVLGAVAGCLFTSLALAQSAGPTPAPSAPAASPSPARPAAPAIDPELLRRASDFAYRQEVTKLRSENRLDAGTSYSAYAGRLAAPLLATVGKAPYNLHDGSWTITIEKSPELTLWSLPGGNVVMSTAFFQDGRFSAGELASLLAHVYAHEAAGHDRVEAAARLAAAPDGASPDPNRRLIVLSDILLAIAKRDPFEKVHEQQADTITLDLLARSGYDPRSLVTMMKKLAVAKPAPLPGGFAAMHPTWPERVAGVEAGLDAAMVAYDRVRTEQAAKTKTSDSVTPLKQPDPRKDQRMRRKPPGSTTPSSSSAPSDSASPSSTTAATDSTGSTGSAGAPRSAMTPPPRSMARRSGAPQAAPESDPKAAPQSTTPATGGPVPATPPS